MTHPERQPTLFPYTTLFRSRSHLQDPRPPRPGEQGGRGAADRGRDALEADRERPEEGRGAELPDPQARPRIDRKSTRLNSSHVSISYAVFCLNKKTHRQGKL